MAPIFNGRITHFLKHTNTFWFALYTAGVAFCLYTCVYTFRKTFSVGTFEGMYLLGVSYKVWLIIMQVLGYALSKFIGITVISELKNNTRAFLLVGMSAIAVLSWLLFAITPSPWNIIFLFTNGLPLGMIWGIIFSYLEGRKCTEILGAGLSISFIFSSGFAKSVGAYLMLDWGVKENWMPFVASCIFIIPLFIFIVLIEQVPPPTLEDERSRTKRKPMNKRERHQFIQNFLPGIILFVLAYMLLTALRDFRDNFAVEIWTSLGYGDSPSVFTTTEVPISLAVLCIMGAIMLIRNNKKALLVNHIIIITGLVMIGMSTFLFQMGVLNPITWMILLGLGLYLGYVPFNSIFFDRLIAAFQYAGTVGFIMYVADSFGYLGSISVLLFKEFGYHELSWISFFITSGYVISIVGTILISGSLAYFVNKQKSHDSVITKPSAETMAIT